MGAKLCCQLKGDGEVAEGLLRTVKVGKSNLNTSRNGKRDSMVLGADSIEVTGQSGNMQYLQSPVSLRGFKVLPLS